MAKGDPGKRATPQRAIVAGWQVVLRHVSASDPAQGGVIRDQEHRTAVLGLAPFLAD